VDTVVVAFGAALISAMATDSWQQARTSVVALWRRVRPPRQAEAVLGELDTLHQQVLAARQQDRPDIERALAGVWQDRLQELLLDDPAVAGELRRILEQTLTPMLPPADRAHIGQITMTASSYHAGTLNHIAGNQHNQTIQIIAPEGAAVKAVRSLRADIATFRPSRADPGDHPGDQHH
jgi:hypothetical protein